MKKLVAAAVAAVLFGSAVFAENSVSFTNKISSDVVTFSNGTGEFAGFTEKAAAEVTYGKVTAGVDARIYWTPGKITIPETLLTEEKNYTWADFSAECADYYITFSPLDFLTLGWSNPFFTAGSYLPVADDNIAQGDLGADGFDLLITPIENFRIGTGLTFPARLFSSDTDVYPNYVHWNAGADFTVEDIGTFGVTFNDFIENFGVGVYAAITALDDITITAGYTHQPGAAGYDNVVGDDAIHASFVYEAKKFTFGAELVTPFTVDNGYDLYVGALCNIDLLKNLTFEFTGSVKADFEAADDGGIGSVFAFNPGVVFTLNKRHSFGAGVSFWFDTNDNNGLSIPVYWKYTL